MGRVDELRRGRKTSQAIWLSFTLRYHEPALNRWYLFFEGDDDLTYYMPLFRQSYEDAEFAPFICDGKDTVLAVLRDIEAKKPNAARCLFFIDKDFDDILGNCPAPNPRMFVTTVYSIENHLVGRSGFDVIWLEIWQAHRVTRDTRDLMYRCIEEFTDIFARQALPLMAWIIAAKRHRKLNLNDTSFNDIFDCRIDSNLNPVVYRRDRARALILNASSAAETDNIATLAEVLAVYRELRVRKSPACIRGKYQLEAWVRALNGMALVLREKHKVRAQEFSPSSLIKALAGKVPYPKELRNFVDRHRAEQ